MTRLSARYAIPLLALLSVAAVPILVGELSLRPRDGCRSPEILRVTSLIEGSQAGGERLEERSDRLIQWSEGRVPMPGARPPLEFHIVRGYQERRLYLRPAGLLDLRMEPERQKLLHIDVGDTVLPVHLVRDDTGAEGLFAMYLFVYDGRPVEHPFLAQLSGAFSDLLHGTRPLTLMLIGGVDERGGGQGQQRAKQWIVDAWKLFHASCKATS